MASRQSAVGHHQNHRGLGLASLGVGLLPQPTTTIWWLLFITYTHPQHPNKLEPCRQVRIIKNHHHHKARLASLGVGPQASQTASLLYGAIHTHTRHFAAASISLVLTFPWQQMIQQIPSDSGLANSPKVLNLTVNDLPLNTGCHKTYTTLKDFPQNFPFFSCGGGGNGGSGVLLEYIAYKMIRLFERTFQLPEVHHRTRKIARMLCATKSLSWWVKLYSAMILEICKKKKKTFVSVVCCSSVQFDCYLVTYFSTKMMVL